jgi:predicted ATPase
MKQLRVKNFGPITGGYNCKKGWLDIKRVTFFCGPQGSGKSTLAKLISTFSWIEKALLRGDFSEKDLTYDKVKGERFEYLGIGNYFSKKTEIEFEGSIYSFSIKNEKVDLKKNADTYYIRPKIMYIPAERSFLCSLDDNAINAIKGFPQTLSTLQEEYEKAKSALKKFKLPVGDTVFSFDEGKRTSFLTNGAETYMIPVSESASGYQSLLPLTLVSLFLADPKQYDISNRIQPLAYNVIDRIKKEVKKYKLPARTRLEIPLSMETNEFKAVLKAAEVSYSFSPESVDLQKNKSYKNIINFLSYFYNQCFLNIVEEPEQNLFPLSQRNILFHLFSCNNKNKNNQLIITTHSPYIIYYLTLAIKSSQMLKAGVPAERMKGIINEDAMVQGSDTIVYEISKDGEIKKLPTYKDMPSDENILNKEIIRGNTDFEKLLRMVNL